MLFSVKCKRILTARASIGTSLLLALHYQLILILVCNSHQALASYQKSRHPVVTHIRKSGSSSITNELHQRPKLPPANRSHLTPAGSIKMVERPTCSLDNLTSHPLGHRWVPTIQPSGQQHCLMCECTLNFVAQDGCYTPVIKCKRFGPGEPQPSCPPVPEVCSDGRKPAPMPNHNCCLTCNPEEATGGSQQSISHQATSTLHREALLSRNGNRRGWQSSGWQRHPARALPAAAEVPTPQQSALKIDEMGPAMQASMTTVVDSEVNFDLAPRPESLWLFKVIAKTGDNRELISAVKSLPLCALGHHKGHNTTIHTPRPKDPELELKVDQ